MKINIRKAIFPADFAGMAGVLNAMLPEWPVTAQELERKETLFDGPYHRSVFVAELIGAATVQLIGLATASHEPAAHQAGKFRLQIEVRPDKQGRGTGSRLYQELLDHLEPLATRLLLVAVSADDQRAVRFAEDRGFEEERRRIESRLAVQPFDFSPYASLENRVNTMGLIIKTYAELAEDPSRPERLYELDWQLYSDIPTGDAITKISLAQFEQEWLVAPDFLPQACFIALKGEQYIGYSNLTQGEGYYLSGMTGVIGEYRGLGVATLLKLNTIKYARTHGELEIRTVNDDGNLAMLTLNRKLGFKQHCSTIRFVKKLG